MFIVRRKDVALNAALPTLIVGYGGAEKQQVQEMVKLLLKMSAPPTPHDAADALALAICHFHHAGMLSKISRARSGT